MSQKVTAIIPTFNEEECIERAIRSVNWADEILVVDSYSTDKTLDIARKYDCRIIQREYENSASQKNWAIPQVKHDWIFLLDADEEATEELKNEVLGMINSEKEMLCVAYWIKRQNYFMGKKINFCGWQRDKVIRLFNKQNCHYDKKHVHAEIVAEGKVGQLKYKINHHTYKNMPQYLEKFDRYSTWSAKDRVKKTKKVTLFHLFGKPYFRFCKQYFFNLGILDGKVGFILCAMAAYSVFLRYLKVWRLLEKEEF